MRVYCCIGKAVALALLSVSVAGCEDSFGSNPRTIDAQALGAKADPQLRAFYAARNGEFAWDRKSEKQLVEIVESAPTHGLRSDLFLNDDLPKDREARELALTRLALHYASALAQGYSDPNKVRGVYTVPRAKVDLAPGLAKALTDGNLADWFGSLPPQTQEYRALSAEFVRYLKLANEAGNGAAVAPGKAIRPGRSDPRLPAIATALVSIGYLEPPPVALQRYTPAVVAAVKRLQADYGEEPDGIIGADTVKALSEGPGDRARQLAVNLERLRWLDRNPPETRIDVNTSAAYLDYFRNGRLRDHRKVVVGQPDWQTPQLGSPIFQLVAHPYWRVPDSIFKDELADKGPAYFAEQNMEFRNGRLVQLPGPRNSLGEVKFDMRNDQHIYLHDTPFRALFDLPERHRSHGCIRVQDALGFAMLLASDDGVLPKFEEAMMKPDEEGFVKLRKEVPVRLLYHTAFVEDGTVKLANDIYGWDDDIAYALGYVRRPPRAKQKLAAGDVGP